MASRLFALDGAEVVEVDAEAGCGRTVWVRPAGPQAAACPGCGTVSAHVKEYVTTRPADLGQGRGEVGVAHAAFAARADPVLAQPPPLVAHLGIDEHRRGRPRWLHDDGTGEYVLLADRWHTCFFDLSGDQGLPVRPCR